MEQRPQFLERWGQAEALAARMTATVLILAVLMVAQGLAMVWIALSPKPVYFVNLNAVAGKAVPGPVPSQAAGEFASAWVLGRTNFTSATVKDAIKLSERFMTSRYLSRTRTHLKDEMDQIDKGEMAQALSWTEPVKIESVPGGFSAVLKGNKRTFAGREEIEQKPVVFKVALKFSSPSDQNPWGLSVDDVEEE